MKKIHVYAHTHWDYEWYFTASESIVQLIYHMDEVISALQNGILHTYLLDSQVSILEEYLMFMPEKMDVIKQLVKDGKLQIGPWYTQSDELIITGESMARNLWYGMKYAMHMGDCLNIGYLPDSFGQSKDMPKLYNGFGIHDALFWRGMPQDVCRNREFIWKSKDGSEVLTSNLRDGYFYGGNLIYNDDVEQVEKRILEGAVSEDQLLSLGGDQRYVDFNIEERIQFYNAHTTQDFHYVESDLPTYFEALRKERDLMVVEGEFIDASVSKIHHSIYSTRYDHKQLNDRVERRMLYQLEPFMVMQMAMGIAPKVSVLEKLWKKLLLNHAHDSACGCNSDATNRSILQRLQDCDQMSSMMLDYQVRKLSESLVGVEKNDVILYNTLPYTRTHGQELEINTVSQSFLLRDAQGNEVPFDVISCERMYGGSIRKDESLYDDKQFYYRSIIRVLLTLSPLSINLYHVCEEVYGNIELIPSTTIENEQYRISIQKGRINLCIKESGKMIRDVLYIEDGGDDGDTYDYSYPEDDRCYALRFENANVEVKGRLLPCMRIKGEWRLPSDLAARKSGVSDCVCHYEVSITLVQDSMEVKLKVDNQAIEHRLRAVVRSALYCDESIADTAFGTIRRHVIAQHSKDWQEVGYREEPTPIYPMLHHVTLSNAEGCMSCFTQGIKEYEILHHQDIALTLFRSVPYLGKPDLLRRPGIASGNEFKYIKTSDACLLQTLEFTFHIRFAKNYHALEVHKSWMNQANDFLYYQMQEVNRFVNTQKYFVTHPYAQKITAHASIVSLDMLQDAVYSTLYPLDDKRFVLRIYNTAQHEVVQEKFHVDVSQMQETNFLQQEVKNCTIRDGVVEISPLAAEQIQSYEIVMK